MCGIFQEIFITYLGKERHIIEVSFRFRKFLNFVPSFPNLTIDCENFGHYHSGQCKNYIRQLCTQCCGSGRLGPDPDPGLN
jgi:hypothetical protein